MTIGHSREGRPLSVPWITLLLVGLWGCSVRLPKVDTALTAETPPGLPALPNGPALRVLVIGDFGTGEEGQREVAQAIAETHRAQPPAFVLTVGDNVYPSGVESVDDPLWETIIEDVYKGPFWEGLVFRPALGNHDVAGDAQAQVDYSHRSPRWDMPARYYTFQEPIPGGDTVRFLALDTNIIEDEGTAAGVHTAWMDSVKVASREGWVVAYGHHPMITGSWHSPEEEILEALLPRFQGWAALYLAGHNHSVELLQAPGRVLQGICGGGAGRDNAYRVERLSETLAGFSNGGWCFLYFWQDRMAVELYNRVGTLRFRHIRMRQEGT